MISYVILQSLAEHCLELLNATSGMISGKTERTIRKSNETILGALRKIAIANEMIDKDIICISGLQGAGKSTLVKNFYGMSDEYFNIALGVGEKIPVFISENSKCTYPEMYAVCLNKDQNENYHRDYIKMNSEEFRKASAGNEIGQNIMYLELRVPYKHLNNFSVKCSDTSIFVFNESSFSKYDNQILLDKIHDKFGDGLIYAISQSDLSDDDNASVKNTCIEVMKIEKGEQDRVVCVGEYSDQEQNEKWISELKRAIDKYCTSKERARKNCTEYILSLIHI